MLHWPPDVSTYWWGRGLVQWGPMKKFKQVCNDDYQMSLAEGLLNKSAILFRGEGRGPYVTITHDALGIGPHGTGPQPLPDMGHEDPLTLAPPDIRHGLAACFYS